MPELPEVETVRRGLSPVMEGGRISHVEKRRPDLRFPFPDNFEQRLTGQTIEALSRRAKYLLADLTSGEVLVMHLGMSGAFRIQSADELAEPGDFHHERSKLDAHNHVVITMQSGATITYNDPRRFGYMALIKRSEIADHPWFASMGPEPVGNALSPDYLASTLQNKKSPIKAALLDQRVVSGLGNIYVCEALWRACISPKRIASTLITKKGQPSPGLRALSQAIVDVIADAIKAGGSTLRDHRQPNGELGYFQHSFDAYDREDEPCKREACDGKITRITQSGRSSFFCNTCQG